MARKEGLLWTVSEQALIRRPAILVSRAKEGTNSQCSRVIAWMLVSSSR